MPRIMNSYNVAVGATSVAAASATGPYTRKVRVVSTTNCWLGINTAANTTTSFYLPANWPEYLDLAPGVTLYVIQATAGGTLNITEVN